MFDGVAEVVAMRAEVGEERARPRFDHCSVPGALKEGGRGQKGGGVGDRGWYVRVEQMERVRVSGSGVMKGGGG